MEVLSIGRMKYNALVPCLVASFVGDLVCRGIGIHHHNYMLTQHVTVTPQMFGYVLLAGVLFAGASALFTEATHRLAALRGSPLAKAFIGGLVIFALTIGLGTHEYNGLSLPV